jgi:hypothetical protein
MPQSNTYNGAQEKMMNTLNRLSSALHSITPHISDATNGLLNKIGVASLATGGTNAIVATAIESQNPTWLTISNAVAIVSIVGSIMFMIKLSADFYYARKRDIREQEAHDRKMSMSEQNE